METIIYQGQSIKAQRVGYVNGRFTVNYHSPSWYCEHDGEEDLYRDAHGRYYLRRKLDTWEVDSTSEQEASGRVHVHRLSLKAAVLWTTMRSNAMSNELRRDARAAFAGPMTIDHEGHTLIVHLSKNQHGMLSQMGKYDGWTLAKVVDEQLGDYAVNGLEAIYEHNEGRAWRGWYGGEGQPAIYTVSGATLALAARYAATDGLTLEEFLRQTMLEYSKATVTRLDEHAYSLLERYQRENRADLEEAGIDFRDLVNGAVVNWLECDFRIDDTGRTYWQAAVEAMQRRRGLSVADKASPERKRVSVALLRSAAVNVLDEEARTLLRKYLAGHPGLDPRDAVNAAVCFLCTPEDTYSDREIAWAKERRLESEKHGEDPSDRPTATIRLIDPQDGGLFTEMEMEASLHDAVQVEATERSIGWGAALMALLHEFFAERAHDQQEVGTGFSLEPKAVKLLAKYGKLAPDEDPRDVLNAAAVFWLQAGIESMESDPEGRSADVAATRRRRIRREGQAQGRVAPTGGVEDVADGGMVVTVRFKPEPARLLRSALLKGDYHAEWYLYEGTRHMVESDLAHRPGDDRKISRIFEDNAPDDEGNTDFDLSASVHPPADYGHPARQNGLVEVARGTEDLRRDYISRFMFEAHQRLTTGENIEAFLADETRKAFQLYPVTELERTSLHGLNAAAPEVVSAQEVAAARAAREGQPAPMRNVLVDLAAGWRIEGAEKGGRIANVLTRCADALEAALEGKEGR